MNFLEKYKVQAPTNYFKKIISIFIPKKSNISVLEDLIDSITVSEDGNTIHIKTNKNILLENNGHTVIYNKGIQVMIGKEIHLNPEINIDKENSFKEIVNKIEQ